MHQKQHFSVVRWKLGGQTRLFGGPARSASEREIREYHDVRIVRAALTRRPVSVSRGHIALRRRGQF